MAREKVDAVHERKHRLPPQAYIGVHTVAFTACIRDHIPIFRHAAVVEVLSEYLLSWAHGCECEVVVYCFMPDHLHAMLRGTTETCSVKVAFDEFKRSAGL